MEYARASAHKSVEVAVSAADFWKVLLDWGALMDWIPKLDEDPPAPVVGCVLLSAHGSETLPCTRRVYLQSDGTDPGYLDETLLSVDHETRRLYYNFGGVGVANMRNYHATTFIDETGPRRCRVTCASQFDIPTESQAYMEHFVEAFYERAIIGGIERFLLRLA
jgi:hypothetical protein